MTGLFQTFKPGRAAPALFSVLLGLLLFSCDMFVTDLETFFAEQTGGIVVGQAAAVPGRVAVGTDGYVCLEAAETGFSLPVDNPLGYTLRVESSFTPTYGEIGGVTAGAEGKDRLVITIPAGQTAGNEGVLHIKVRTAKEGRTLYEGDTGIAFMNFMNYTAHLGVELSHSLVLTPAFNPAVSNYAISNTPDSFSIRAAAVADPDDIGPLAPLITIDGESGRGVLVRNITPPAGGSTVLMRVELPHGAAGRNYSFEVHPAGYSGAALVPASPPTQTVYAVGDAFNTAGLKMNYVTGESVSQMDLDLLDFEYDFTTPGTKVVTVTYTNLSTGFDVTGAFTVYVVGLSALTVTGPGPLAVITGPPGSGETVSSDIPGAYTLASVPFGVSALSVNAVSAVAGVDGANLAITRISPSFAEGGAGVTKIIPLDVGSNTIKIEVTLTRKRPDNSTITKTETWTLDITRATLNTEDTFYVAGPGGTLPEGSDAGDGTQAAPFATIKHALDLVKESGLGGVLNAHFTIIVSGTVTDDTGSGTNGMVAITGSYPNGYPHITLRGIDAGTNAIDAAGKRRVLYITDGNKLTLGAGLTLTGGGLVSIGSGVWVTGSGSGSTFTMTGDAVIKGNTGDGVSVSYGTFAMDGNAVIENNTDRGVSVNSSGIFTMGGAAVIKDNTDGGVSVYNSGTFTMSGGVIKDNTSEAGGGVYVRGGTFTMSGDAVIKDNTASSDHGGGVYVWEGTFTMNGGVIEHNTTAYLYGGGIYVSNNGSITKTGGTIYGSDAGPLSNIAPYGRAVYLNGGKRRDTTVGTGVNLYAKYSGGWSYVNPDGNENTEPNWTD